ncbi:MAG: ankyrin repeat domain-containing protein [Bdellovibrionota bacterium]
MNSFTLTTHRKQIIQNAIKDNPKNEKAALLASQREGGFKLFFRTLFSENAQKEKETAICSYFNDFNYFNVELQKSQMISACKNGDVDSLSALIKVGADVNAANKRGETPVMLAAANGHVECLKKLIAAGADVKALIADKGVQEFIVMSVIQADDVECFRKLIAAGV